MLKYFNMTENVKNKVKILRENIFEISIRYVYCLYPVEIGKDLAIIHNQRESE